MTSGRETAADHWSHQTHRTRVSALRDEPRAAFREALHRLDRSPVKSIRYRGVLYKSWLAAFVVVFLILGYLGVKPTTVWGQFGLDAFFLDTKDVATWVARLCTIVYFQRAPLPANRVRRPIPAART